jgi:multidrug efflux pump subunit AcrA (membrane-fusion protein)
MTSGLKLVLITLPIAAIGAGILAFIVSNSAPPERIALAERASAVRVITAETYAITPAFVGFGLVAPARTFEAIAEVGGVVEYVNPALRDGQILPAGSVMLRLSSADFTLAIAQANANIRAAESRLAELAVSEANQHAALEIEREVLAVKATDLARAETLFAAGTATLTARDNARAAHLAQRQKVQSIEGVLALFPTQRAVQNEQIAVYQSSLASAQLNLARIELTLPFTARVATHTIEIGQFLKAGQTAAILDGIDQAEVVVQVPLNDLRNLLPPDPSQSAFLSMDPTRMGDSLRGLGLTAQVRLRLGAEIVIWPAAIDRISNGIDPRTGTVGVVVRVDAAYGQAGDGNHPPLTKGMFVDVMLSAPPISGIVLPRSALHDGQVHIADADSRLRMLEARPQLVQGGIALFTDGIDAGSRVVLSTPSPVIEGLLLDLHPDNDLMPQLLAADAAR